MNMWQPISSAPKDGSEFLAYDPSTKKMDVCAMQNWNVGADTWVCFPVQYDGEMGPNWGEFGYNGHDIQYLWTPLPEAPE